MTEIKLQSASKAVLSFRQEKGRGDFWLQERQGEVGVGGGGHSKLKEHSNKTERVMEKRKLFQH